MSDKSLILTHEQIIQKTRRIAFEIYEHNFQEKELVLVGIYDEGYNFAKMLEAELSNIAPFATKLVGLKLDKAAPTQSEISLECTDSELKNKAIILVDDVSNTGKTMAYSLKPFLTIKVKKIEAAVLVNRSHTQFPIAVKYSGFELATTIKDHVTAQLEGENKSVYLI